ncbi:MAG TPA: ABC transporter permease [Chthoniobacterales bacterium]|nr:ABC transporter permease [Chthoniobacterales bacterium]
MLSDLKFAFRSLGKNPGFTLIAVITLALGIGANTAIFSVVNGVLLRPLPYPDPQRLVTLRSNQSVPELEDLQSQSQSFETVGGVSAHSADYSGGGEPIQIEIGLVASDFFRVLGTRPMLGRTLSAADDRFGGERVAVLSHGLWQRQFGGDLAIIGKSISLAGQVYTVVGITPADFRPPRPSLEAFVPIHVFYPIAAESRGAHLLRFYARLRPGVTMTQAQNELRVIDQRLAAANPDENKNRQSVLMSLQERMVGNVRPALLILFGAVGLVLLIGCANFANLLLARMASRSEELTVRAALGASRGRLVRQVLVESTLLSLMGGGAGLLLGSWGIDALLALKPEDLPRVENVHLDGWVLVFTLALALLTGVIFGLVPAWQATRTDISGALSSAGRRVTAARSRFRNGLVIAELSLALVLLVGAGLLGKAFWRLTSVAPGFNPENVVTMRVDLPEVRYKTVKQQTQFREQVLANLNDLPGVQAAIISELPLGGNAINHNFIIEGRPAMPMGEEPELYSRAIMGDYFRVLGIPLLRGRPLNASDRADVPAVGVINESMAQQYFRGQDPIGARIRWARSEGVEWITIVGVVGNVRHFGLANSEEPAIYTPYAQSGQDWKRWSEFVVRSPQNADPGFINQCKNMIWKVDPSIPVTKVRAMPQVMSVSLAEQRFNAMLLGIFAGVALLLASVGLYGVLAFSVAQRTREIGIRVALGAQANDVLRLVLRQGLTLSLVGVAAGTCVAWATTRVLTGLLYGVAPTDLATFGAVTLLFITVALAACLIPARRALRVDPVVALRHQ